MTGSFWCKPGRKGSVVAESDYFDKRKVLPQKLEPFGFTAAGDDFVYTQRIAGGQFEMKVQISQGGKVLTEVTDIATGEAYVLHLVGAQAGLSAGYGRIMKQFLPK